ncbi:MAG TPA: 1,2-phenylacetyl-CoA epoxidase subunit PaaE [Chitinophagaceae bacterium]|nr:1,2-phenylacetyl-CoA epoxidase subunit PaaE [Chitinophagaceae bacterium]
MATHFQQLEVIDVRRETASCISVAFAVPAHLKEVFAFTQGQNITIKAMINGEELRRSYSVCSSPLEGELRIAIKRVADGKFSSWAATHLQPGVQIDVLPPSGKFFTTLHPGNKKQYIAFAAGSGITPILSIIKTVLATEPGSSFTLFYGNKNRASIIFRENLEALKNLYMQRLLVHHIFSREKTDNPLNEGRIDAAKCQLIFDRLVNINSIDEFFLCGPAEMIFTVKEFLEGRQVPAKKIHYELFSAPGKQMAERSLSPASNDFAAGNPANITIRLDGLTFDFTLAGNADSILDAALAQGADLPFACKGGVCATCRAKLVSGEVSMDNNYALEPEELKNGYILTCQSHPRSQHVFIDFDQR